VRELFQRIRNDDDRIVLASSGKEEDTKYYIKDLVKVDDLIEGYTCADDADRSKPAPDIFTAALDKLGEMLPSDAITIGDTRFDIEAAAKAGMATIGLLCGGTAENVLRDTGAIAIFRDPADMFANYDRLTDYESAERGDRITGSRGKKLKR
jgi:phosphoglycolate phosphatase-like HAD superfamily hydrolase